MSSNCSLFDDDEENKHEYFTLYREYFALGERLLEERVRARLPDIDLACLLQWIARRRGEQQHDDEWNPIGELQALLHSFLDFSAFKRRMIDYRRAQSDEQLRELSTMLRVSKLDPEENNAL